MLESHANISILLSGMGKAYASERALLCAKQTERNRIIAQYFFALYILLKY